MKHDSIAAALEREHHTIDVGIDTFSAGPAAGERDVEPLRTAIRALRRHIYLEEEFLFPALQRSALIAPILVMLREHGQIWTTLDALECDLDTGTVNSVDLMTCHRLVVRLQHHNLKEEKIIYPRADQVLTASDRARLKAFIDGSTFPDGWVCERAGR